VRFNLLVLLLGFLISSCSTLNSKQESVEVWKVLDAKFFQYSKNGNFGSEQLQELFQILSNVYDEKESCIGPNNVKLDVQVCKNAYELISNHILFQELGRIDQNRSYVDNVYKEVVESNKDEKALREIETYQNYLKNLEEGQILIKKVAEYVQTFSANKVMSTFSNLVFENTGMEKLNLTKAEVLKALAKSNKLDEAQKKRLKECEPFEKEALDLSQKLINLRAQYETSQTDAIMNKKKNEYNVIADKYRFLIFNRKYKGCPTYQGKGD
jgi:hypothetical protein